MLAYGAKVRSSTSDLDLSDSGTTYLAWPSCLVIDCQHVLEATCHMVRTERSESCPFSFDGSIDYLSACLYDLFHFFFSQSVTLCFRVHSSREENLVSVNVANSTYNLLIEKDLFDFGDVSTRNFEEIGWRKSRGIIDFRP